MFYIFHTGSQNSFSTPGWHSVFCTSELEGYSTGRGIISIQSQSEGLAESRSSECLDRRVESTSRRRLVWLVGFLTQNVDESMTREWPFKFEEKLLRIGYSGQGYGLCYGLSFKGSGVLAVSWKGHSRLIHHSTGSLRVVIDLTSYYSCGAHQQVCL